MKLYFQLLNAFRVEGLNLKLRKIAPIMFFYSGTKKDIPEFNTTDN